MRSSKKLTYTAMLLAMTLVFQSLRLLPFIGSFPHSTLIIGTLVNLCLFFSVLIVGENAPGLLISVCAPVVAYMQQQLLFVALIPFVALGNAALVICFYYLQKLNKYAAVVAAAAAKWAVLFLGSKYLLHLFLRVDYDRLQIIIAGFNAPQLITALAGGFLALLIYRLLPKDLKRMGN